MPDHKLSKDQYSAINQKLGLLPSIVKKAEELHPNFVAITASSNDHLGVATICLQDAIKRMRIIRHSLWEAHAHLIWFREVHPKAPVKFEAVVFGRYYLDNAILRIYPLLEDLAEFIVQFRHIPADDLKKYKKKNRTSTASAVGEYLKLKIPNDEITPLVSAAHEKTSLQEILRYRGKWVHGQPPNFKDEGIAFKRGPRWKQSALGVKTIGIGGGDPAEYDIDEMLCKTCEAYAVLSHLLGKLAEIFIAKIKDIGIEFTE